MNDHLSHSGASASDGPDPQRRRALHALLTGAGLACIGASGALAGAPLAIASRGPLRILHVMSYHSEWAWNQEQFDAFKAVLADLDVDYQVVELDAKRHSDPAWLEQVGAQARALIDSWQPDLVYTNDDYAQDYVVAPYASTGVPFVFSAVNAEPAHYGFDSRSDVTGVLEHEHSVQTVRLLRELVPVRRIAVLMDQDPTWLGVMARMQVAFGELPDLEVAGWDVLDSFAEYRRVVADYQDKVDALAVLGVFNLRDEQGADVPFEQVLRWTAENSSLPDFSFWSSRVELGTLAAVGVSGPEQGRMAGEIARKILVDGISPASIPMRPSLRGQPVISLARARQLGIQVPSSTLLKAQVLTDFAWG